MHTKPNTFSIISLGCPKNLIDSEHYVAEMECSGAKFSADIDGCETVILNTCGFLRSARDEAREYIAALLDLKEQGRVGKILVKGCMPQFEQTEKLREEFPGVFSWNGVPDQAWRAERHLLTQSHVAYLKIAEGCSRGCTFCAIPKIRGPFRSFPLEEILTEARRLAELSVKELVVIAQETTFWGLDLAGGRTGAPRLADLLRELEKIDGIRWIRLMYSYPQHFGDDLIELFAAKGKLLPYVDIPLQHANDEILKRMNRRVTKHDMETLLGALRDRVENLVLRTSLIVGFPGETDEKFDELFKFVERWKFERAGVFQFSAETGTAAATFADRVPKRVAERRHEKLYSLCEAHSTAWANRQKGRILDVQIDGNYTDPETGRKEANLFLGRTFADAPDIDPVVYVTGDRLQAGDFLSCEILETEGCDLVGVDISGHEA